MFYDACVKWRPVKFLTKVFSTCTSPCYKHLKRTLHA
uniref:Uncharacterized protein n=1 Tax=Anopheles atroparvus TaxID=41427 RepID=A0AAG5DAA9_ANOAO